MRSDRKKGPKAVRAGLVWVIGDTRQTVNPLDLIDRRSIQSNCIGFTDFEEGSKSEIFRRCDAGASNENLPAFGP